MPVLLVQLHLSHLHMRRNAFPPHHRKENPALPLRPILALHSLLLDAPPPSIRLHARVPLNQYIRKSGDIFPEAVSLGLCDRRREVEGQTLRDGRGGPGGGEFDVEERGGAGEDGAEGFAEGGVGRAKGEVVVGGEGGPV